MSGTAPGVSSFNAGQKDLELHPTAKPVAMVADVVNEVSKRGDSVLGGSGMKLVAAHRNWRVTRLVECDARCLPPLRQGKSECIRSDNGSDLVAAILLHWLRMFVTARILTLPRETARFRRFQSLKHRGGIWLGNLDSNQD